MEPTKRKDAATTTRESYGIKESEMKTDEDDEFDRIERENKIKGQPYHFAPQNTWEGFTEEEFVYFCSFVDHDILDQIENVLREKNELR